MRVVQLGSSIACAQATLLLMRFGATVAQTAPQRPEPFAPSDTLLDDLLAFGKTGLARSADDLTDDELAQILDRADAIVDDHPLSYWRDRGLDLRARYENAPPYANWCALTPYGLYGIGEDWAGCELTFQASGPMMQRLGEPGRSPIPVKGPQAEIAGGWHGALLVAAAQLQRGRAGRLIDISLQECQYMHSELGPANWHFNAIEVTRIDPALRTSVFPALDGDVHMLFHDREWPRVARMIGREDLAHDERFLTRHQRTLHLDEVDSLLVPWFMERTRAEAVEAGQAVGMPIALDQTPEEILADPQLAHRQAFEVIATQHGNIRFPLGVAKVTGDGAPSPARNAAQTGARLEAFLPAKPTAVATSSADPLRPLQGIRVLDLTNTWAGPRGATMLGDLGADVIKVEGVEWMDMLRGFTAPPTPHESYPRGIPGDKPWDRYLMWLGLARNKRNLVVEFTRPEGRTILDRLVAVCDVVITNMSVTTRAKYGLEYQALHRLNPRVVFGTLSGYGDEGPRSSWKLFGDGQAAIAGLFYGTGYDGEGTLPFGAYGDPTNGVSLAYQVTQALLLREQTGSGSWVDVSCVETCLTYNARSLVEHQVGENAIASVQYDARGRWPHGVFRCAGDDRWIAISCATDAERAALAQGLTAAKVAVPAELAGQEAWEEFLSTALRTRDPEPILHRLRRRGVSCQNVMRARDVDGDAILSSRGFLRWLWREDLGTYPVYSPFWLINGQRPPVAVAPARFGEHNEAILTTEIGMTLAEVASLRQIGVIGNEPVRGAELGLRNQ